VTEGAGQDGSEHRGSAQIEWVGSRGASSNKATAARTVLGVGMAPARTPRRVRSGTPLRNRHRELDHSLPQKAKTGEPFGLVTLVRVNVSGERGRRLSDYSNV
jgi:hypothetical protein